MFIVEFFGGLRSVMWTDSIQTAVMLLSFIVVPFILNEDFGDFIVLRESQNCEHAIDGSCGLKELGSPYTTYPDVVYGLNSISFYIGLTMYFFLPQIIQRVYASNSQSSLKVVVGTLTVAPFLCMLPGTAYPFFIVVKSPQTKMYYFYRYIHWYRLCCAFF